MMTPISILVFVSFVHLLPPTLATFPLVTNRTHPPIIFIPSFHGTLLSHCASAPTCKHLYLSPLSGQTYHETYRHLLDHTHTRVACFSGYTMVEYPASSCYPSPSTSRATCVPRFIDGPVYLLNQRLQSLGFGPFPLLKAAYDWRLPLPAILHTAFTPELQVLVEHVKPAVILAHGFGCPLAAAFLTSKTNEWRKRHVRRLVCVAAPLAGSAAARDALRKGDGLLTAGQAHRDMGAGDGRDVMAGTDEHMGRWVRQMTLDDAAQLPNEELHPPAAPREERIRLANSFGSLKDIEAGWMFKDIGVPVTCVVGTGVMTKGLNGMGDGDGVVEKQSAAACKEWKGATVHYVRASHFNLTALVGGTLERIVEDIAGNG